MNAPDSTEAESSAARQGAQILVPGGFPTKLDTVTADVLARLLSHERMTSLDGVSEASTTRLAAYVHYLADKYGWPIEVRDKAAGCRDGRVAWVAEYWLRAEIIATAIAAGASEWCTKVGTARRARRANAAQAKRDAQRANAARLSHLEHSAQSELFERASNV